MHVLENEKGSSRFNVYLFFLLFFLAIHIGLKIVPMFMEYSKMKDAMSAKASQAHMLKDEEILQDLANKAAELELPLTVNSFVIQRDAERSKMKIGTKAGWNVEVFFFNGAYIKMFHFEPVVEEKFMNFSMRS